MKCGKTQPQLLGGCSSIKRNVTSLCCIDKNRAGYRAFYLVLLDVFSYLQLCQKQEVAQKLILRKPGLWPRCTDGVDKLVWLYCELLLSKPTLKAPVVLRESEKMRQEGSGILSTNYSPLQIYPYGHIFQPYCSTKRTKICLGQFIKSQLPVIFPPETFFLMENSAWYLFEVGSFLRQMLIFMVMPSKMKFRPRGWVSWNRGYQ